MPEIRRKPISKSAQRNCCLATVFAKLCWSLEDGNHCQTCGRATMHTVYFGSSKSRYLCVYDTSNTRSLRGSIKPLSVLEHGLWTFAYHSSWRCGSCWTPNVNVCVGCIHHQDNYECKQVRHACILSMTRSPFPSSQ